ncbi:MAG: MipA/OmpV family protein [Planctomycetota bacterium]
MKTSATLLLTSFAATACAGSALRPIAPPEVASTPVRVQESAPEPVAVDVQEADAEDVDAARLEAGALPQADWGIAAVVRTAGIPFDSDNDTVSSFVPMMFYEGSRFFVRGTSGGAHLWKEDDREINALTRLRFFDIPSEFQNTVQGDTADFGLQYREGFDDTWWEAEFMSDARGNVHANVRAGLTHVTDKWVVEPGIQLRYGSPDFVSRYYAVEPLTGQSADGALILTPGVTARYHLIGDLYLVGSAAYSFFDQEIRDLDAIDDPGAFETFLGFGFFQDRGSPQFLGRPRVREFDDRAIELAPHLRLAHGWATPSNLGSILSGDIEDDEFDNQLTSLFYGYPLTDRLFGLPLQIYLSPGAAFHDSSEVQDETFELVLKIHLYYTFRWPIRWRLGVAEGISWIEDVTFIERQSMLEKGYRPSELMNYLDFTLDLNVGDLFGAEKLERLWFGVSIHHRSSIFESASQFGRIKGGSNYPSIYLQWDLF